MNYLATRPTFPSVCLSILSTSGSRANGVLLCVDVLFQASPTVISHPPRQGWQHHRPGGENGTVERDMSSPKQKTQAMGHFVTKLCGLHRCKWWSHSNAKKRQFARKVEGFGEPRDLAFWGVLRFSVTGIFFYFLPHIMNNQSSAASHLIDIS